MPQPDSQFFEFWIRVGNFILVVVGLGGVLWRTSKLTTEVKMAGSQASREIAELKNSVVKLGEIVTTVAVQKNMIENQATQITQLREEINLLRRGKGFIQREIDGQYP